jgi:DNA-binding CsgD family transcriptional regulator
MIVPKLPKARAFTRSTVVDAAQSSRLEISGRPVRVMQVDDVPPRRSSAAKNGRVRITYVEDEIAHFELDGHRYALVCDRPAAVVDEGPEEFDVIAASTAPNMPAPLTNRELQICQLICMGYLTKQVAARLKLSEFTVRSYLKNVYCKLSVRSRGAMVYRFTQMFLNAPDPGNEPRRAGPVQPSGAVRRRSQPS